MASRCNATAAPRRRRRPAGLMHYAEKRWDALDMMASVSNRTAMGGVLRLGVAKPSSQLAVATPQETHQTYRTVAENRVDITSNLRAPACWRRNRTRLPMGPLSLSTIPQPGVGDYPIGFVASPALKARARPVYRRRHGENSIITFARRPSIRTVRSQSTARLPAIRQQRQASLATRST